MGQLSWVWAGGQVLSLWYRAKVNGVALACSAGGRKSRATCLVEREAEPGKCGMKFSDVRLGAPLGGRPLEAAKDLEPGATY